MNITLLEEKIDTFNCEIDNAYGVIVCLRVTAENNTNEAFKNFAAELYGIEHYLKLLTDILKKETESFNRTISELNILSFYKKLKRVHVLFLDSVAEAPCDENTTFLHRKAIGAAFAAYGIVENLKAEFSEIMEGEHDNTQHS